MQQKTKLILYYIAWAVGIIAAGLLLYRIISSFI